MNSKQRNIHVHLFLCCKQRLKKSVYLLSKAKITKKIICKTITYDSCWKICLCNSACLIMLIWQHFKILTIQVVFKDKFYIQWQVSKWPWTLPLNCLHDLKPLNLTSVKSNNTHNYMIVHMLKSWRKAEVFISLKKKNLIVLLGDLAKFNT